MSRKRSASSRAAGAAGMPVAISFTVETDGRLPTGQSLRRAIEDGRRETGSAAGLLHDQLRPSRRISPHVAASGEAWTGAAARPARQRLDDEPRRARRGHRRSTPAIRWSSAASTARLRERHPTAQRARRLLRHRPPPRRTDLPLLPCGLNDPHGPRRAMHEPLPAVAARPLLAPRFRNPAPEPRGLFRCGARSFSLP